mmetsp:Transcript_45410/g.144342  ORF Transcript_45410/g.144342 Transcript_45410/m.144342 type:complete len:200 (-) Transcript_45410:92-691(-)
MPAHSPWHHRPQSSQCTQNPANTRPLDGRCRSVPQKQPFSGSAPASCTCDESSCCCELPAAPARGRGRGASLARLNKEGYRSPRGGKTCSRPFPPGRPAVSRRSPARLPPERLEARRRRTPSCTFALRARGRLPATVVLHGPLCPRRRLQPIQPAVLFHLLHFWNLGRLGGLGESSSLFTSLTRLPRALGGGRDSHGRG